MDNVTLKKYFNLGNHVEVICAQSTIIGNIVDFSDSVIVIEDSIGNPAIISLDSIISCKKTSETNINVKDVSIKLENVDINDNDVIISNIIKNFDSIFSQCVVNQDELISTNAKVTNITQDGVEVIMDEDERFVTCKKSSFVGYSRDNAAIGKRLLCHPDKHGISYASLSEMTYGELHERFLRAINTRPIPRTTIIGSVLYYLTQTFGNDILPYKKEIKSSLKKLHAAGIPVEFKSSRFKIRDLTEDQKNDIYSLIDSVKDDIKDLDYNEKVIFIDNLIAQKLEYRIGKILIKSYLNKVTLGESEDVLSHSTSSLQIPSEETNIFVPATGEIKRYFPKYHYGFISDGKNEDIRFKDDIVIGEDLKKELNNCWNTPIPVICSYKKNGKFNTASFLVKPGTAAELLLAIKSLKDSNKEDLANELQNYIEKKGYTTDGAFEVQLDLSINSQRLLETTRKQRLIKNFTHAEKGFLELISRKYEFDSVVRDLAMMYQEWQGAQKSISFLEKHLPYLEDKIKSYNMLTIFYLSIRNEEKAIYCMEESLKLLPSTTPKDLKKREKLAKKIERLKKKDNTKESKEHIKDKNPLYTEVFPVDSIPAPLLVYDINNNTDKVLSFVTNKNLDEKIAFVRERIVQLKNTPELPSYYLAQIQLLQDRGDSVESLDIKRLLADYCKAKARNFFNEDNIIAAREYLLQGILILEREDLYYLLYLSMCISAQELLVIYNNVFVGYEEIAANNTINKVEENLYVILRIINMNSTMSRRLIRILYENESYQSWICGEMDSESLSPQEFVTKVTSFAKIHVSTLNSFENKASELLLANDPIDISTQILNMQMLTTKHANSFDIKNISILREIANLTIDFDKKTSYDECDEISRSAIVKIDDVVYQIEKAPSQISTLYLLPLLLKQKDIFERAINKKYMFTLPQILVKPIDDARQIEDKIELQLSITNELGSSRAENATLSIDDINGVNVQSSSLVYSLDENLLGGTSQTCIFYIKKQKVDNNEFEIEYTFKYQDVRKTYHEIKDKLTVPLNTGVDYEDFDNPYIAHVKSNAVKDKSMFKGRNETIDTICKYVLEDYKGYILYGQKRSGKSSVLYHITQKLRSEHKAFAVEYTMGNNIVQDSESEKDSMANLFYTIISEIGRAIKEVDRNVYKECDCRIIRRSEFQDYPDQTFREYLDFYRDIIVEKLNYEHDKIVLIVDEFTYLYYHILEGKISPRIMEFWKGLIESRIFSFVFAGQDAMPRFMDEFQNVFASMHPQELTYIDEQSARELIEEPIWNSKKNCSRFHPEAVNEILKLTACSPFYIMILCSELVKYARQRKRLPISVNDVNSLVQRMVCNESSISRKDFDNLISCGESRLDIIDKDESIKVLKDIAVKSRNIEYYDVSAINVYDKNKVRFIIEDLLRRGVLELHPEISSKVKIKVGLFKRWLLNHE